MGPDIYGGPGRYPAAAKAQRVMVMLFDLYGSSILQLDEAIYPSHCFHP